MVELGGDYAFSAVEMGDRGWVFCPDYTGLRPLKISPDDWSTQIFLFSCRWIDARVRYKRMTIGPTD